MAQVSEDEPGLRPARRVAFEVTAYLVAGTGGYYDLRSNAGGGHTFSIPTDVIDQATLADAPPEELTDTDWEAIGGQLELRLGPEAGRDLLRLFRALVLMSPPTGGSRWDVTERVVSRLAAALHTACTRSQHPMALSAKEVDEILRTVRILTQAELGSVDES